MITYEYDGERLSDNSACAGVRADLKICLLQSDCCRKVIYVLKTNLCNRCVKIILFSFSGKKNTKRMPSTK